MQFNEMVINEPLVENNMRYLNTFIIKYPHLVSIIQLNNISGNNNFELS